MYIHTRFNEGDEVFCLVNGWAERTTIESIFVYSLGKTVLGVTQHHFTYYLKNGQSKKESEVFKDRDELVAMIDFQLTTPNPNPSPPLGESICNYGLPPFAKTNPS